MDEHAGAHRRPRRTHFLNTEYVISIDGGFACCFAGIGYRAKGGLKLMVFLPQLPYHRDCWHVPPSSFHDSDVEVSDLTSNIHEDC